MVRVLGVGVRGRCGRSAGSISLCILWYSRPWQWGVLDVGDEGRVWS